MKSPCIRRALYENGSRAVDLVVPAPGPERKSPATTVNTHLILDMPEQPDDTTCGPTCLHAVYGYYGDCVPLQQVIAEVPSLPQGGTLGVVLANHALRRGYRAVLYTFNLQLFDPSWMGLPREELAENLRRQRVGKSGPRVELATEAFLEFLERGGEVRMADLTGALIRRYLRRATPVLAGLSSTWLYRTARENPVTNADDPILGEPAGHFVVLCGYDKENRTVKVADPYHQNPLAGTTLYDADVSRVIGAVLLGTLTYDSNLIILEPGSARGAA